MRAAIAGGVGLVALASGLMAACGGASGSGDIGLPGGADATVDVAEGDHAVPSGGDDASGVDVATTPPEDSGGPGPNDTGAADAVRPEAGDASPVDGGGADASDGGSGRDGSPDDGGSNDGGGLDAPSDAFGDGGSFSCGPSLTCDSKTQYCSHAMAAIIVLDAASTYSCVALPACDSADICSCLTTTSPTDTCTCTDSSGGITRTCMCRVCASP